MEAIAEKAKDVFKKLSEIQPVINIIGLEDEAGKIIEMKKDMADVICALSVDETRLKQVVDSCFADTLGAYEALRRGAEAVDLTSDAELSELRLAAELFAARAGDYLDSKARVRMMFACTGEKNGD